MPSPYNGVRTRTAQITCRTCSDEFDHVVRGRGSFPAFCSEACRATGRLETARAATLTDEQPAPRKIIRRRATGTCFYCSEPTVGVYCNAACRMRDRRGVPLAPRVCGSCDAPFPEGTPAHTKWCKSCKRVAVRAAQYGVSVRWLRRALDNYRACPICGDPSDPVIDHDHETGAIRGLICHDCNAALGLFQDSPLALRAAATYLEREHGELGRVDAQVATSG